MLMDVTGGAEMALPGIEPGVGISCSMATPDLITVRRDAMPNCGMRREAKRIHQAGLPRLRKGNQSCRGQALLEIALVLWTFFVLAFALIDFSWLMFSQMNMQDAVREAGRYASTGNHLPGPGGTTDTRIQSIT